MSSTLAHWTQLYVPALTPDKVKPVSNDFPAILWSIANAFDAAQSHYQDAFDDRYPTAADSGDTDGITVLTDTDGHKSWVDFDENGDPGPRATAAMTSHGGGSIIAATAQPPLTSGQQALWFKLDPTTGDVIDILTGKG